MKKNIESVEISETKLRELYDRCDGYRSHYLILTDEPAEFIGLLVKEGWITHLKNGSNRPWYCATNKLITQFRELSKEELAQIKSQEEATAAQAIIDAEEEARAQENLERRKNLKI